MAASSAATETETTRVSEAQIVLAIALLAMAFLFSGIGRYGVVNADEAIYHGIAERMAETGDFLHLDFRGEPRVYDAFMNAPLHYWARAALISLFDSSRVTMRALSALFGVLTVLATYALGRRLAGRRAGILAALVQLSTFHFVYLHGARTGELDTLATCLIVGAAWALFRALEDGRSFVPHHLLVAALVMTKAPLAVVPVVTSIAILATRSDGRRALPRYLATGVGVLPLALAWHATQVFLHAGRVGGVLGSMLGQASGAAPDGEALGVLGNARFYATTVLHGAYPWSVVYPFALLHSLRRDPGAVAVRRALAFAVAVLGFFLLVSKHFPWYVMPAYPFLSLAVGVWLADLTRHTANPFAGWGAGFALAALACVQVGALDANPFGERALTYPMEASWRFPGPFSNAALLLLAGGVGLGITAALRHSARDRLRVAAGGAVVALLFAVAAVRNLAPLAFLDHEAPIEGTKQMLDLARREGRPVRHPVRLRRPVIQIARFHFGEDFEIVPVYGPGGTDLDLYPRDDPTVLERSIGRGGLTLRLSP